MRTSGSWFSFYLDVHEANFGFKSLEIGTALGVFLCIQLLKDDSWLELEKWGYFSLCLKKVRWKNLRSFRWLIVECLIDEV